MPAARAALGPQLLFQVLVLAPQARVLALQAVVLTMQALVARQFVTQSPDLPVLLLDDNVPRIPLGRGLFQDGAYAAQQAHAPFLSAPRIKTFTPNTRIFPRTPLNEDDSLGAGPRSADGVLALPGTSTTGCCAAASRNRQHGVMSRPVTSRTVTW